MNKSERQGSLERLVHIKLGPVVLEGNLSVPAGAQAIVLFVHGSGSGRFSSRNQSVARFLREGGLATLLFDLLTAEEETVDLRTRHLRFDIDLLADRVTGATEWLRQQPEMADHGLGYFGASTGAAAALIAATRFPGVVKAVVSRGGRPDLAQRVLSQVEAATLFIVGGHDTPVIDMNRSAYEQLVRARERNLEIIPGATHLFTEPGALEEVARLARDWFKRYLVTT